MTKVQVRQALVPARSSRKARYDAAVLLGLLILAFVVGMALLAGVLRPGNPQAIVGRPMLWPGTLAEFPLGTDMMGRDVLAGLLYGARVSLVVGIVAAAISLLLGTLIGALAGYFGGLVDAVILGVIEIFQTIPNFVLLIALVAFAQPSATTVIIGIALVSWDMIARIARAEIRAIRNRDYVMAAESVGMPVWRILWREILPNALPPLIVSASVMVAAAILLESALAFLGLGDPNLVSWGSMIGSGRQAIRTHWYLIAFPGLCIFLTVLALNLLSDALNDFLAPRQSGQRGGVRREA